MCVCICVSACCVCMGALKGQKGAQIFWSWRYQALMSCLTWVLETELKSFGRAESAIRC